MNEVRPTMSSSSAVEDHALRPRVDRGRGLVEDEDRRVLDERARHRHALALAARQARASLAQDGVVALGQPRDEVVRVGGLRRRDDLVHRRVELAVANVVGDRAREQQRLLEDHADLVAQRLELEVADVVPVDRDPAALGVVEADEHADEGRLAGARRADDRHALAGPDGERDVVQRVVAALVGEVHVLERDGAARAPDRHGVRGLLDLLLRVEQVQRRVELHELVVELADRRADLLERLVDGGDVGDQHEQLADGDVAPDHLVGAEAQDETSADRGRAGDREREQRLAHGQLDALLDRLLALLAEPPVLVALASERDDDPQHRHRLVDDRQRLPLLRLDELQAGHDARAVEPERVPDERHGDERDDRDLPRDQRHDDEHADQRQERLGDRRRGEEDHPDRRSLHVDLLHQLAGHAPVVERQRQALRVVEQIAAQVEHHALLDLRVDPVAEHGEGVAQERDQEPCEDREGQQRVLVGVRAEHPLHRAAGRPLAQDVVDDDRQRPRLGQRDRRRGERHEERADHELAVRLEVREGAGQRLPQIPRPLVHAGSRCSARLTNRRPGAASGASSTRSPSAPSASAIRLASSSRGTTGSGGSSAAMFAPRARIASRTAPVATAQS
jgi:hypothetical protein